MLRAFGVFLGGWFRSVVRVGLVVCVVLGGFGLAQPEASLVRQMRALLEQGYFNSAARLNGPELVARFPESGEARFLFARALYLTGDFEGAERELGLAVGLLPEVTPEVVNLEGLLLAARGEVEGALGALRLSFVDSGRYEFGMDWGRVAWQFGRYEEAIHAFGAAGSTPVGRRELWPLVDMGRVLVFLGRLDEAIAAFNAAIDVFEATDAGAGRPSPAYVEAYFRLGEAYEGLGDSARAELNYRAARTADPNYVPAVLALDRLSRRLD